ncbi:MAG: hypothetical protein A2Z25_00490 [Planctomycetes bacterium RBG_16_55_9]|nr:MAG: hypothetical protein A2Z25_00490 [Planctomycetes bacterium RBG_16_55_9]
MIMAKQSIAFFFIMCFSIIAIAGKPQAPFPSRLSHREKGMTSEKYREKVDRSHAESRQKFFRSVEEKTRLMSREVWKRLLRVNEQQWKTIEPKYEKYVALRREAYSRASGWGERSEQTFHWNKHSMVADGRSARTLDEMTEGEKIADALVDLLEDENTTDEAIRQKIDALQKLRDAARKQIPEARQELKKILTTPRQEAVFLVTGCIK